MASVDEFNEHLPGAPPPTSGTPDADLFDVEQGDQCLTANLLTLQAPRLMI